LSLIRSFQIPRFAWTALADDPAAGLDPALKNNPRHRTSRNCLYFVLQDFVLQARVNEEALQSTPALRTSRKSRASTDFLLARYSQRTTYISLETQMAQDEADRIAASRRTFLRGAGMTGIGLAGAAMIGSKFGAREQKVEAAAVLLS
jgi:hypothetical protein